MTPQRVEALAQHVIADLKRRAPDEEDSKLGAVLLAAFVDHAEESIGCSVREALELVRRIAEGILAGH